MTSNPPLVYLSIRKNSLFEFSSHLPICICHQTSCAQKSKETLAGSRTIYVHLVLCECEGWCGCGSECQKLRILSRPPDIHNFISVSFKHDSLSLCNFIVCSNEFKLGQTCLHLGCPTNQEKLKIILQQENFQFLAPGCGWMWVGIVMYS